MNQPETGIAIIILTMNQREKTLRCLSSLFSLEGPRFDVLLWDHQSQDGTAESVRQQFPGVLVHHCPRNLGVASGRNAAAQLAIDRFDPAFLLFLDNDIVVEPGFVEALWRPLVQDERIGQTQAKLRFLFDPARLNDGGGCRINFILGQTVPVGYGELDRGQHDRPRDCVACGGAMMVRTTLFQSLGGFDATFDPFGPEDLDFSLRLRRAGYRARYIPDALAYHEVSHTYGAAYGEDYARNKVQHWLRFMRRHASLPEQIAFFVAGGPYGALRVLIRESRRGNFAALRGIFRGMLGTSNHL